MEPKFTVRGDDVFFCIGSCFARVIEHELLYRGISVSSLGVRAELAEVPYAPNGFVNKYTTASMLNELRWSLQGVPFPVDALVADGAGYRDLQLAGLPVPVSFERARSRRFDVTEYFARLRLATVVIVTLGLVEVWYDRQTQLYLNHAPTYAMTQSYPGRFTVHTTNYEENRDRLAAVCDLLTSAGRSDVRIVVTVSPVPLQRTFVADDVLSANGYSKATLRAAAGDVVLARTNVEYFPAYELVTVSDRAVAFDEDQVHVSFPMAETVVVSFLRSFGLTVERPYPEYAEGPYLQANADVKAAVVRGAFATGYDHWLKFGRAENRPLKP